MTNRAQIRLLNIMTAVCVLIAAVSGILMAGEVADSRANKALLESLAQAAVVKDKSTSDDAVRGSLTERNASVMQNEEEPLLDLRKKRQEHYAGLKEENPDMAGWISIEGSRIDYPVTQSIDRPDFYLTHNFQGKESGFGNPYLSEICDLTENPDNLILYGHHMKDGSMFADLMNYTAEDYYKEHSTIRYDTLTELGDYRIIAVLYTLTGEQETGLYRAMRASNREEYENYVSEAIQRSIYDTGLRASYGEKLLTLITCEYSKGDGRLVIVAKKQSV